MRWPTVFASAAVAEKDAADRASIVAALERQLAKGDKALVGNTGYRRYLKTISDQHFAIDPDKIAEDNKFDGIFVLRTNTDLNPLAAMLCYKQLWTVEQTFRTAKHLLSTRPIFHKLDETIRGHVFCSFLALVLKKALEDRITALGRSGSWPETIADLDSLTETEIEYDGKRFIVRSPPRPAASLALRAAGVALPPTVRDATASLNSAHRKCSAKPPLRRGLPLPVSYLVIHTVEDGLEELLGFLDVRLERRPGIRRQRRAAGEQGVADLVPFGIADLCWLVASSTAWRIFGLSKGG